RGCAVCALGGRGARPRPRRNAGGLSAEPPGLLSEASPRLGATAAPLPLAASAMMSGVRIGIDARKLHDFGIGTYIRNLLRQLARLDRDTQFIVLSRPSDSAALGSLGANFRIVPANAGNYSISEQVKVPIVLKREAVTLFHAPHYVLPPLVPCRSVVTIHDCIHLMFPQYLPNRFAFTYARASIAFAARRATRVLTVSESSKRDILRFVDLPPE